MRKTHNAHLNLLKLVLKSKIFKLAGKKRHITHRNKDNISVLVRNNTRQKIVKEYLYSFS